MSQFNDGTSNGEPRDRVPTQPGERHSQPQPHDARRFARRIDCAPAPESRDVTRTVEQHDMSDR